MDTQNTPIHIKLWHHDFWRLCFANLFLMISVYMLIPAMPVYLLMRGFLPMQVAAVIGVYGIGVFALGGFCSYLVQRYRRNRVCQISMLGVVLCHVLLYYLDFVLGIHTEYWMLLLTRFALGAFLGLAQITLASTLIIDTCESFQRTEANYITSWFSRFGLAVGPAIAVLVLRYIGVHAVLLASAGSALLSWMLVSLVKFPFKAPSEHMRKWGLDRFFLPLGMPLFVNMVLVMVVVGLVFCFPHSMRFYLMVACGMLLALIAEKYVFADADLKSEIVTGLLSLGAALLIVTTHHVSAVEFVTPVLAGFGVGVIGSRFLLFYIKLAGHCQRGTSVSSFFLAWEFGLTLGLCGGFLLLGKSSLAAVKSGFVYFGMAGNSFCLLGVALAAFCLLIYNFLVHPWYMKHRNR